MQQPNEFIQFRNDCREAGVRITSSYVVSAGEKQRLMKDAVCPDSFYYAVAGAGLALAENPEAKLIREGSIPDEVSKNYPSFAARWLVSILNDSANRRPPSDATPGHALSSSRHWAINTCGDADRDFARLLADLQQYVENDKLPHPPFHYQPGYQIVLTKERRPIGIRKRRGVHSMLSLEDLDLNGIRFPAGSLFGIALNAERSSRPNSFIYPQETSKRGIVRPRAVARLAFARLSPLAEPPDNRLQPNGSYAPYISAPRASKIVQGMPIEDIRALVSEVAERLTPWQTRASRFISHISIGVLNSNR